MLKYGSIIWDPYYVVHINSIESVQKQFLQGFCLRSLGCNSYELPPYQSRLVLIKLPTLKSCRSMISTLFILELIRGYVNSEFLHSRLKFNVPVLFTHNFELLSLNYWKSDYKNTDSFRRACKTFNECYIKGFTGSAKRIIIFIV